MKEENSPQIETEDKEEEDPFDINSLEIIPIISDNRISSGFEGEYSFHVYSAFKDQNNYISVFHDLGYTIMQEGEEILSEEVLESDFRDVIYTKYGYFIYETKVGIYKKNFDDEKEGLPVYLDSVAGCQNFGKCFKICLKDENHILALKNNCNMCIIDISQGIDDPPEIKLKSEYGGKNLISDFEIFCEGKNFVLVLLEMGCIQIFEILDDFTLELKHEKNIEILEDREEWAYSFKLFSNVLAINLGYSVFNASRFMLFEVDLSTKNFENFVKEESHIIDFYHEKVKKRPHCFNSFDIYKKIKNWIIFTGITCARKAEIMTFAYNGETNQLLNLENLKDKVDILYPKRMNKVDKDLLCCDNYGSILVINYQY